MGRKVIAVWLSLAMVLGLIIIVDVTIDFTFNVGGATLYVNTTGSGGAYTSIQDAINASKDGDTVFVYNGTYYEHILVNKTINLIGEDKENTIIDGGGSGDVVRIVVNWVNASGFTITRSGPGDFDAGIELEGVQNCSVFYNNVLSNRRNGVFLNFSHENNIIDNNASSNVWFGINLYSSDRNKIFYNNALNNWCGVYIDHSNENNVTGNNASFNSDSTIGDDYGILIWFSNGNIIYNNNASSNDYGINIRFSSRNNVINNKVSSNIYEGISLCYLGGNNIIGNTASNNKYGINMYKSSYNNITSNNVSKNIYNGIYLVDSSNNNTFHHNNIIDNVGQLHLDTARCSGNVWNDSNGEGNYWSDYTGLDDGSGGRTVGDGVGDTEIPHPFIDQGNGYYQLDNYPLMDPVGNCIFLHDGWNLISIPFIQSDTNLGTVLDSIRGSYDALQWYSAGDVNDIWKHNQISKPPHLNDLNTLDHKMGFWIHVTELGGALFEYPGTQPTSNQTITLHPGWNMVGYPSLTSYNRTDGLNNLTFDTHVDAIWTYNAATQKWKELGSSDYFEIGRGYWIHAKSKCEWEVPL